MGRAPENFFRLELIKTASDLDIRTRAQASEARVLYTVVHHKHSDMKLITPF